MRILFLIFLCCSSYASATRITGLELNRSISGHPGMIEAFLTLNSGEVIVKDELGQVFQRDAVTGKVTREYSTQDPVGQIALSANRTLLLTESSQRISAWNWRTGQRIFQIPVAKLSATALAYSEASSLLVVSYGELQTVYDVRTRAVMYELKSGSSNIDAMALTRDGKTLIAGYRGSERGGDVWVFDARSGKVQHTFKLDVGNVFSVALALDDTKLLVGGAGRVALLDLKTERVVRLFDGTGFTRSLAWNARLTQFAVAADDTTMRIFGVAQSKPLAQWTTSRWLMRGAGWLANGQLVTASGDGSVTVWAKPKQQRSSFVAVEGPVWETVRLPDGQSVITAARDGVVRWWSIQGALLRSWALESTRLSGLSVSADGKSFAAVSEDRDRSSLALIYSFEATAPTARFRVAGSPLNTAFSPDGRMLAVADREINLFDIANRKLLKPIPHEESVHTVEFTPDGVRLIVGGFEDTQIWTLNPRALELKMDGKIRPALLPNNAGLVAVDEKSKRPVLIAFDGTVTPLGYSSHPASRFIVSKNGSRMLGFNLDDSLSLWDMATKRVMFTMPIAPPRRDSGLTRLSGDFLENGNGVILGGPAGVGLKIFRYATTDIPDDVIDVGAQDGAVRSLSFSPDDTSVIVGSDRALAVWNLETLEPTLNLSNLQSAATATGFSADGQTVGAGLAAPNGLVNLWKVGDSTLISTLLGHRGSRVQSLAFSPDGSRLVTASADATIKVWSVATGKLERALTGYASGMAGVAFTADGAQLVVAPIRGALEVWEVATWNRVTSIALTGANFGFAYSSSANLVALGGSDGVVAIVDLNAGTLMRRLAGGVGTVRSLTFDQDAAILVTTSFSGKAMVWDVTTGTLLATLGDARDQITAVKWSNEGETLATGHESGRIRVWTREIVFRP